MSVGPDPPTEETRVLADGISDTEAGRTPSPKSGPARDPAAIDLDDAGQRHFGDYELTERIGHGGMGVVYRARQHGLDRDVAIKLLAAGSWASADFVERFRREARSAARMQHPNIVEIYEIGARDGLNFFSMRLIDGRSLAQLLEENGPLPAADAARLVRTLAEAVDYAHRMGVLHLDLKPANVLLTTAGEPLIADFGLARGVDADREAGGEVSGTPAYMAPEQAQRDSHPLTASTDIHGLGATLYKCLTDRAPFRAADANATLAQVIHSVPASPGSLRRQVPADLDAICLKCLEKDPAKRYASARALADDLGRFLEGRPVAARPLSAPQRAWRWARREPRVAVAGTTAFLALVTGLGAATLQWQAAEAARATAEVRRAEAVEQRRLSEERAERNVQLASLMAQVYPSGKEAANVSGEDEAAKSIVAWLQRELPGRDEDQAEILTSFIGALDAADKPGAAHALMVPVAMQLGTQFRQRAADALVAQGGGLKLAMAAMLLEEGGEGTGAVRNRQVELLRDAVALLPADRDVVMVAAMYCDEPACADFDPQRRLAQLEPDNAVNWVIASKWVQDDPAAVLQNLLQAARTSRADDHYARMMELSAQAIAESGVPIPQALLRPAAALSGEQRPEELISYLQAWTTPIPSYQTFQKICVGRRLDLSDPGRGKACLAFARLLVRDGKGLVAKMIGSAMIRNMLPGSAEAMAMRELRRQYSYVLTMRSGFTPRQQRLARDELMAGDNVSHGELEAMKRTLDRAGVPREPPVDWAPDDPMELMTALEREAFKAAQAKGS